MAAAAAVALPGEEEAFDNDKGDDNALRMVFLLLLLLVWFEEELPAEFSASTTAPSFGVACCQVRREREKNKGGYTMNAQKSTHGKTEILIFLAHIPRVY